MTAKQKAFCEEYVKSYNATAAYLSAFGGEWSNANSKGCMMLRKPEVAEYIRTLQEELVSRWGDVASIIVEKLLEDINYTDEDGKHSATWTKSVDLLQKQLGLQNQKIDVSAEKGITINITGGNE